MEISKILMFYFFRVVIFLLMIKIFTFTFDKSYILKSYILRILLSIFIVFIFIYSIQSIYRAVYPLDVPSPSVSIKTIDKENPKTKTLMYNARVINRTTKNLDIILIFNRIDSDLYPYIDLIPKTFTSDKITLKAKESKKFIFTTTVDSEDIRLITSHYEKFKVKYIKQ